MKKINLVIVSILVIACSNEQKQNHEINLSRDSTNVSLNSESLSNEIDIKNFKIIESHEPGNIKFSAEKKIEIYPRPEIRSVHEDSLVGSKEYWALFQNKNDFFYMKKIKAKNELYEAETGASFNRFQTSIKNKPIFIFEGIDYSDQFIFDAQYPQIYPLKPGDLVNFSSYKERITIFSVGSIQKSNHSGFGMPFDKIVGYSIYIQRKSNEIETERVLFQRDTMSIDRINYEISIGLDWIGDLDLDGKVDLILTYSNHYASFEYRLYLSSLGGINNIDQFNARYIYSD